MLWGVSRAGHLGKRAQEIGSGEEGCRKPGKEGVQTPVPVPIFGTRTDHWLLEPPKAGYFPRAGAVTPGRGEPAGRSCGGSAGRTGGGAPLRRLGWAFSGGRGLLVVVRVRAPRSHTRPGTPTPSPRPHPSPWEPRRCTLEKCSRAIRDFFGSAAGGMRVGLRSANRALKIHPSRS